MSYQPLLKICGVTNTYDAQLVSSSGADFCGIVVDVDFSERSLSPWQAKEVASASNIPVVILLGDPEVETAEEIISEIKPYAVQLLWRESPELVRTLKSRLSCRIWKTIHLPITPDQALPEKYVEAGADALVVDSMDTSEGFVRFGGTGKVADWKAAAALVEKISIPIFLAGGINPENIDKALIQVHPFGIDLCSGVEASKGKKDPDKVRTLVDNLNTAIKKMERT